VNFIDNADHADGVTDRQFVGLFKVFGQISLSYAFTPSKS